MKPEEIEFELKTLLQLGNRNLTADELTAIRCAIPMVKRCERYRKALRLIDAKLYDPKTDDAAHMAQRIIAKAFDCEEI